MEAFELYTSILTDHHSGSSGILRSTIEWVCESLESGSDSKEVMTGLEAICNQHASMALLHNLKNSFADQPISISAVQAWMETYLEHEWEACKHFSKRLAEQKQVLVYSNSGMLENSFRMVPSKLKVYCMESRPGLEGIVLAEKLSRSQHQVTVLTDMAAFSILPGVDALAFGCDAITPDGIVNKIGTSALAAAARTSGKRNFFVGTSEKRLNFWKREYLDRQGLREEIYSGPEPVQVKNFYFDLTPTHYIDELFLETGAQRTI